MHFGWKPALLVMFSGLAIWLLSCSKWDLERIEFTEVITVGVIEVGASSAFLIGDIEGLREGDILETGFVYSSSARDKSALQLEKTGVLSKVSLRSDTTADRAFAVRITGLETNTSYSFRAYIKLEQEPTPIYGQIDSFRTPDLTLEILSIQRQSSGCPTKAVITLDIGQNQSSDISAGIVWTDSEDNFAPMLDNATVITGTLTGSNVQVELDLECDKTYFLRGFIVPQGSLPVLTHVEAFSTSTGGKWMQRADHPENIGSGSDFSFSLKNLGYFGVGALGDCFGSNTVWEYNALTNDWISNSVDGIGRDAGISFTIGNTGYVGLGVNLDGSCPPRCARIQDDLWKLKDGQWQKISFQLPRLNGATSFVIGEYAYFGAGVIEEDCFASDNSNFWRFDPASGISMMDPFPESGGYGFSIKTKGYVSPSSLGHKITRFYEFDPAAPSGDQWKQIPDREASGNAMVLGSKAYFVGGNLLQSYSTWEFDPAKSSPWRQVATLHAGGGQALVGTSLSINNLGYVLIERKEDNFWMYVPEL